MSRIENKGTFKKEQTNQQKALLLPPNQHKMFSSFLGDDYGKVQREIKSALKCERPLGHCPSRKSDDRCRRMFAKFLV